MAGALGQSREAPRGGSVRSSHLGRVFVGRDILLSAVCATRGTRSERERKGCKVRRPSCVTVTETLGCTVRWGASRLRQTARHTQSQTGTGLRCSHTNSQAARQAAVRSSVVAHRELFCVALPKLGRSAPWSAHRPSHKNRTFSHLRSSSIYYSYVCGVRGEIFCR